MKSLFIPSPCPFFSSEPIWLERNSKELFTLSNPYIVFIWITVRASLGTPQLILGTNPTAHLANPYIFAFVLYILGVFLGKILKEIEISRLSSNWGFCVSESWNKFVVDQNFGWFGGIFAVFCRIGSGLKIDYCDFSTSIRFYGFWSGCYGLILYSWLEGTGCLSKTSASWDFG